MRSLIKAHLKLSGVVRRDGQVLRVRNAIYERVFTVPWARSQLPVDWRVVRLAALGLVITGFIVLLPAAVLLSIRLVDAQADCLQTAAQLEATQKLREEAESAKGRAEKDASRIKEEATQIAAQAKQEAQKLQADADKAKEEANKAKEEAEQARTEALQLKAEAQQALEQKELVEKENARARAEAEEKFKEAASYVFLNRADDTLRAASAALPISAAYSTEALRLYPSSAGAMDSLISALAQLRTDPVPLAHDDTVLAVTFSPDGSLALTASEDETARLWEVATGHERLRFRHEKPVTAVAFSPDGSRVATASEDGTARLWNTATGCPWVHPFSTQASSTPSPSAPTASC